MLLRRWIIVLLLTLPGVAVAQTVDVDAAVEDWLGDGVSESAAAEMGDEWIQLLDNPVNINDTAAMAALPFISPFQHRALCNYILLYGQLETLKELAFVPGFDSASIAMIAPMVKAEPFVVDKTFRPWRGHHSVVTGVGGTVEQAEGYRNGNYEGDNLRSMLCYTYDYQGKLNIRIAADKDPGESWGKGNYYGYHIMLSNIGRLRRIVVGRYNLQFGQGLTLWTGLAPFNIAGEPPMRFGQGIKPAGAFYEDDYLEGVATTVDLWRSVSATAFASRTDGSDLIGGRVGYRKGNFVGGVTMAYSTLDDSVTLREYVYNRHYFRGDRLMNVGADAMWQWQRLTLYGEAAMAGDSGAMALAAGAIVRANSDNRFGISVRHFDRAYHSLHAQAYAVGSTQNESGIAIDAVTRLPLKISATLSLDLHTFPSLRYGAYTPSNGQWLRVRLDRSFGKYINAAVRYVYRYKERNVPNIDSNAYIDEGTLRQQLQGEVRYIYGRWTVAARGVLCHFDAETNVRQAGWAAGVTARYTVRRLQATAAATWYDVDGYYARIYLSESNLQYVWNMPALNGRGLRSYLVLRYNPNDHIALAAKYSLTLMPGEESIGSNDARTEGSHRQTWHLQLRLKL